MASLIAIPFLIGSVPLGLAVVGANHFLKDKRKTNKFLYWGGITASAFGGWVVSNMLMTRYVESEVLSAEFSEPYFGKGGLDFGRDTKGRFRRKLVIPIQDIEYEYGNLTIEKGKDMEIFTAALNRELKKRGILARCESSSYEGKKATIKLYGLKGLDWDGEIEATEFALNTAYDKIAYPLDWVVVDFNKRTYDFFMKGDKIEKNAESMTEIRKSYGLPHYFYRWIGGSSGNPIYFGHPDRKGLNAPIVVHYVHPIYDEEYLKTLVDNLNIIDVREVEEEGS